MTLRSRAARAFAVGFVSFALAPGVALASTDRAAGAVVAVTAGPDRVGSGIVVAADLVLTAAHVVDATHGRPGGVLVGGDLRTFTVMAVDGARDLALLSVHVPEVSPIVWGSSAGLRKGGAVVAVGFPIGSSGVTLTKGVVTWPLRTVGGAGYVHSDAPIDPGNTGGALVDAMGRLVGVAVARVADVNVERVGLAVPGDEALSFVRAAAPSVRLEVASRAAPASGPRRVSLGAWLVLGFVALLATALAVVVVRGRAPRVIDGRRRWPAWGVLEALSDGTCRRILKMLREEDMTAVAISAGFTIGMSSISRHLSVLRAAGLVTAERRGQEAVYSLSTTVFQEVFVMLLELRGGRE